MKTSPSRLAYIKQYSQDHPDVNQRATARWKAKNPNYWKEYYQRNKALVRERSLVAEHRRRAARYGVESERISRPELYKRDGGICGLCKKSTTLLDASIDHIIPISRGGPHTWANVQLAHKDCNRRRGVGRLPAQLRLTGDPPRHITLGLPPARRKLTPEVIETIRHATGSQRELARRFSVNQSTISDIRRGVTWTALL